MPPYSGIIHRGKDDFGAITIRETVCNVCGENQITVRYKPHGFELPEGIDVEKTILKDTNNALGIGCGHYARFHRQIAHIVDQIKLRRETTQSTTQGS